MDFLLRILAADCAGLKSAMVHVKRVSMGNEVREMRLTLRTLLAYLDDVLSPTDTKMIGQKIQESPMAQLLVSRIREVMRRRRLKAPEVFGPEMGVDPNIVAQYLDNTLPASRYADVERVLLASDEMLAEAAACHQVLTLTLANPTEVSQASRDRLYALGPVESTSQLKSGDSATISTKHTPESIATRNGAHHPVVHKPKFDDDERITELPDYLKPTPWSQRLVPSSMIILLVIVCAAVLAPGFMNGIQRAKTEIERKNVREKTETVATSTEATETAAPPESTMEVASNVADNAATPKPNPLGTVTTKIPEGIDPPAPADATDDPLPPLKPAVADTEMPADAFVPPKPSDGKKPDEAMANQPAPANQGNANAASPVTYGSTEGILVHYSEQNNHWFTTPHRSALVPDQIVANLEPFDGILDFERTGVRAILVGESVIKILSPADSKIMGFGIGRGHILIQMNHQEDLQAGSIEIAIGEDHWKLDLLTIDTVCGIEVSVRKPTQYQKLNDHHWYQASLYVLSGAARWTNKDGIVNEITDHMALTIVPERGLAARTTPLAFLTAPDWCDPMKRKLMPLRRYQSPFERSFENDKPVDQLMLNVVKSTKQPKVAELAARCLSATDNYVGLVETLASSNSEEARFAARDGLRQWLPMGPDRGALLRAELDLHYPPPDADAMYRMLWGFSRDDVTNSKVASLQFTNWMRSTRLEVRELADFWVEHLSGRNTDYKALDPKESHVRRIEEQIERNNGLVKGP